jgi:(2Fe-2S) ferredoxin
MTLLPEKHVFICITSRPEAAGSSCGALGSPRILEALTFAIMENGLQDRVRVNGTTCLGPCEDGVNMVVYPEGVFYSRVTPEDVDEIVREHLVGGAPVRRLVASGEGAS